MTSEEKQEIPLLYFAVVHFIDESKGWAVDSHGTLYESNEGGATWVRLSQTREFSGVWFVGARGWAVSGANLFRIERK